MEENGFNRIASNYEYLDENNEKNENNESNNHQNLESQDNQDFVEHNSPHSETYIEIITEKDESGQPLSVLEVDLVISREKGRETRRLQINFAGIDMTKKEMVEKSVDIDRHSFERLKHFFCNLDWNS
jgi:hypothetical protein